MRPPTLTTNSVVEEEILESHLESFTCNVRAKLVRNDTMEGKTYKVVPMVMMVVGVHAGSQGALYYPKSELSKTPEAWNHKPVVVYHPTMNGRGVSACSPDVLTSHKIGLIMNTKFDSLGRLCAEAWLDPDRIEKVDARVSKAIDKLSTLECSTGMFMEVEAVEGKFEGEDYKGIARNFRPDHLAVLPDKTGACSVADGAGFIRNESGEDEELVDNGGAGSGNFGHGGRPGERGGSAGGGEGGASSGSSEPTQAQYEKAAKAIEDRPQERGGTPVGMANRASNVANLRGTAKAHADARDAHLRAAKELAKDPKARAKGADIYHSRQAAVHDEMAQKGAGTLRKEAQKKNSFMVHNMDIHNGLGLNEQSFENIRSSLDKVLQERFAPRTKSDINSPYLYSTYTIAVYTDFVVFSDKGKLFKLSYTSTDTKVELSEDDPVEVVRVTEFRTVDGAFVGNTSTQPNSQRIQESTMNKKAIVDGLIANCGWDETDREFLMGLNESQLDKMKKKDAGKEKPAASEKPTCNTVEEFIGQAPAEMQDVLRSGLTAHQNQKNGLIDVIVANASNKFTKEQLNAMPLGQLEAIAALAKVPAPAAPATNQGTPPAADYSGQGGQGTPVANETKQEPLGLPVINWKK